METIYTNFKMKYHFRLDCLHLFWIDEGKIVANKNVVTSSSYDSNYRRNAFHRLQFYSRLNVVRIFYCHCNLYMNSQFNANAKCSRSSIYRNIIGKQRSFNEVHRPIQTIAHCHLIKFQKRQTWFLSHFNALVARAVTKQQTWCDSRFDIQFEYHLRNQFTVE